MITPHYVVGGGSLLLIALSWFWSHHALVFLVINLSLILSPVFWPTEWFVLSTTSASSSRGASGVAAELSKEQDVPLSEEETQAVVAAKRIVAKERAKFLAQNGGFVPMASDAVQKFLGEAVIMFEKNLNCDFTSENKTWISQYKNDKREIEIFCAEFPGHACKRWKIIAVLQTDLETAYEAIFVPEKRRKWDALVKDIQLLQIRDCSPQLGDGLAITSIVTNPVLMVSSRSMLDLALQRCLKRGGIILANVSCPPEFEEAKIDPGLHGSVRAITHIGSGVSIKSIPGRPGYLEYIMISTIELNGWLPPGVVNATMTTSLAQSTEQMQDFFKS